MMRTILGGKKRLGAAIGVALGLSIVGSLGVVEAAWAQNQSEDMATLRARADAEPNNPQALFPLARALADRGQTSQAIRIYNRILAIDPSLARVHLDLGVLLLQNGELEDARHHLAIALAEGRGSPAVQQRVQQYIDEIDARLNAHEVYGYVLTAARFQSNPEAAPNNIFVDGVDEEFIEGLDDEYSDEEGFGGIIAGDLTWIARLEKTGAAAFETHVQLYGSAQEDDDLNLFVGGLDVGPRFRLGSSFGAPSLRVYGFFNHANLAGESFFTGGGGGANFSVNFAEDVQGDLTYELEARDYNSDPVTVVTDSTTAPPTTATYFREDVLEHRFNAELQVGVLGLDAVRLIGQGRVVNADEQPNGNDNQSLVEFGGGIDLQKSFRVTPDGNTWSISGGVLAKQRNYDEEDLVFNPGVEREQSIYRFSATGSIPLADFAAVIIGAGHTITESNVSRFEYDNTEATAGVMFHF